VANSFIYAEEWAQQLQDRLSEPTKWKEICDVRYTDTRVINNPYLATDPTVATLTRGTAYSFSDITETNESLTISTARAVPQIIDRADLAQSDFRSQMQTADWQATLLNEAIEAAVYGNHSNFTDFGAGDISGGAVADTTQINVSATNIDDIIVNIERVIRVAGGETLLERNGGFIVWRPADFTILEQFAMANGYNMADQALRNSAGAGSAYRGFYYMGFWHYTSNQLVANHVHAGVKGVHTLGILRSTFGQIMVDDKDPNLVSGISVVSRVDYGVKVWTKTKPVIFDVNVA
jgi:hypothetical protein